MKWETYPNDLYAPMSEGTWPDGLGQLTNVRKISIFVSIILYRYLFISCRLNGNREKTWKVVIYPNQNG